MNPIILEMKNITKTFPGVKALNNVCFKVAQQEIHCLVGENGAGKSTLMKILSGMYPYGNYSGDIILDNQEQRFLNAADSEKAGIAIIHQELALVPEMTVYENIFLGHENRKGVHGICVNWNETIKKASEMLDKVKLRVNPEEKVKELGVGQQQLVEIAKALSRNVKLLILDEPTAALNDNDSENLINLIFGLRRNGVTCILISHKLKEVLKIADMVTVLRDGQTISTLDAKKVKITESVLIKNMVGREIDNIYPPRSHQRSGEIVLETKNWHVHDPDKKKDILNDISFHIKKGEIVGLAGLMGSGRTELARSIFGNPDDYKLSGSLIIHGKEMRFEHPSEAIEAGLAYASEDRKGNGLILMQDIKQNIVLANLNTIASHGTIDANAEVKVASEYSSALNIKTPSVDQIVGNLSGGNQQKVSIAKWLYVKPSVLILDEPTRGIDVGAKHEIYLLMNKLVENGMSIIMISSELPEVLGMSDRVYVISSGKLTGELFITDATQEKIMELATA